MADIPVGAFSLDSSPDSLLGTFRKMAIGTFGAVDASGLLDGQTPTAEWVKHPWRTGPVLPGPYRSCVILVVNLLPVPLVCGEDKDGGNYSSDEMFIGHGKLVSQPVQNATNAYGSVQPLHWNVIPAAADGLGSFGIYYFTDSGGYFGTEGALRFQIQGSSLPYGFTVGWEAPYAAFGGSNSCWATACQTGDLEGWYNGNVDGKANQTCAEVMGHLHSYAALDTATPGSCTITALIESIG